MEHVAQHHTLIFLPGSSCATASPLCHLHALFPFPLLIFNASQVGPRQKIYVLDFSDYPPPLQLFYKEHSFKTELICSSFHVITHPHMTSSGQHKELQQRKGRQRRWGEEHQGFCRSKAMKENLSAT